VSAACVVLGTDWLFTTMTGGVGPNPFQIIELKTYDWRLTHTARPETARQDIALVEIDELSLRSLQKNAGMWPWPRAVHSMLVDYLARAPAKVVAYDVNFAEADTRRGFDFGDATWSGATRTTRSSTRSRRPATSSCWPMRPSKANRSTRRPHGTAVSRPTRPVFPSGV
jgi:hypothetical protein